MKLIPMTCALAVVALIVTAMPLRADDKPQSKPGVESKPATTSTNADGTKSAADAAIVAAQKYSYPLTTCPLSGHELKPGKCVDVVARGRLVRVCCNDCKAEIEKDPSAALKKIDQAVVAAQKAGYPLTLCPVTGTKLDEKAVDYVYGTRLVRCASAEAVDAFKRDPAPAMAKLDAAYVKQGLASYPLKTCPISNEKLGESGVVVDKLYGTTLVRFCCNDCVKEFEKSPDDVLKKLADARAPAKK